ncbi:hypothetical protein [Arthrobacter bambusae]|uniref:Uncharacterized protein n=1 Tax=Arthrobacter bambusae TaxID=1338426 RepID=A0AAW8DDQ5_9MICC|nr:hypothetical protein [Arthrobacter bambusae]MDP9903209.1 hypothetical protein [Arthrobacter bambusae]MDQ0128797.1 hypothetical protein [Arthrobacter bambusae]MDQ0180138.1 hypothetical protein [Arthrobacter bambusae]
MKKRTRFAARSADGAHVDPGSAQGTARDKDPVFIQDDEHADSLMGLTPRQRRAAERKARRLSGNLESYAHLLAMKPREGYLFRSDYFKIDDGFACILGYFHNDAAQDDFGAFWGINRIPLGLGERVSAVVLEQVHRRGEKWIDDHLKSANTLGNLAEREQKGSGSTATSRRRLSKSRQDTETIAAELLDGASYLHVHNRLLLKAPTLAALETSVDRVKRLYVERFATLNVAPYPGEQRREASTLFGRNEAKRGKGFHYTSTEFAGSYSLVTNGLNDPAGEHVGHMLGDVNNSAVIFDVNQWSHHTVVANNAMNTLPLFGRVPEADLWGSKISQAALLNNNKVVHLVLDGADLNKLGPRLDGLTARLDMNSGDVNFLELFGQQKDELSIFPAHLDKVVLMAEQAYETTENERSVVRGSLRETLIQFYVDKQMWYHNAQANRERLRLVGLPHTHVPRLQDLVTYFDTQYKALANSSARDDELLHAYSVLRLVFKDMLDTNGDLFNSFTNSQIDGVGSARRVIYDFSELMLRGKGIAMAQLVNIVGFAIGSLGEGDVLVIHGAELIDDRVKDYISTQFEYLFRRGGRVAYLYTSIEEMLADQSFNRFDTADWTVLGNMSGGTVEAYQRQLHQEIPPDLEKLITTAGARSVYLRRGHVNVVFQADLALGVNPARQARREELKRLMAAPQNYPRQKVNAARNSRRRAVNAR